MYYSLIAIQTCTRTGGGAHSKNRAHPLPGQGLDTEMFVECSRTIRDAYPVGTVSIIWAKVTDREGGTPFLYSHHSWDFVAIGEAPAQKWIKNGQLGLNKRYAEISDIKSVSNNFKS